MKGRRDPELQRGRGVGDGRVLRFMYRQVRDSPGEVAASLSTFLGQSPLAPNL
jgi:hypothetical protein